MHITAVVVGELNIFSEGKSTVVPEMYGLWGIRWNEAAPSSLSLPAQKGGQPYHHWYSQNEQGARYMKWKIHVAMNRTDLSCRKNQNNALTALTYARQNYTILYSFHEHNKGSLWSRWFPKSLAGTWFTASRGTLRHYKPTHAK
jgi:hypothetical protein